MKFSNPYWNVITRMEMLQRWILVHSFLYYELDYSVVEDHKYDKNCVQLTDLQERYPKQFKNTRYYYAMKDFDGSTGFGFYQKLNESDYEKVSMDAFWLKDRM